MRTKAISAIIGGMAALAIYPAAVHTESALAARESTATLLTYPTSNDAAPYTRELPPGVALSSNPAKSPDGSPVLKIAFDVPECTFVPLVHVPSKWKWTGWLGLHYTAQICQEDSPGWGCLRMEWKFVGNTASCSSTEPRGPRTVWGETKSFLGLPPHMSLKEVVFGVQVKGKGTLWVRNAEVTEETHGFPGLPGGPLMGLVGGLGGALLGVWGGIFGYLVSKGRAKEFVMRGAVASIAFGLLLFAAGVVLLFFADVPYACWYPCGLLGLIMAAVFGGNLNGMRRRYANIELERLNAKDASDGI